MRRSPPFLIKNEISLKPGAVTPKIMYYIAELIRRFLLLILHSLSPIHRGLFLLEQYQKLGRRDDLEQAITSLRASTSHFPPKHPTHQTSLANLGPALHMRYMASGHIEDLEESLKLTQHELEQCPSGHPDRSAAINNRAGTLFSMFLETREMEYLDLAIIYCREDLEICDPEHPDRALSLSHLAVTLYRRFQENRRMEDLQEAISYYEEACDRCPPGHYLRSDVLAGLAALESAEVGIRDSVVADQAVEIAREALAECSPGNVKLSNVLGVLAGTLLERYKKDDKVEDLEESIQNYRQSLSIALDSSPNFGNSACWFYDAVLHQASRTGTTEHLEEAGRYLLRASKALPHGHPALTPVLSSLGSIGLIMTSSESKDSAFFLLEIAATRFANSPLVLFDAAQSWAQTARSHKHESVVRAYKTCLNLVNRCLVTAPNFELQQQFLARTPELPKTLASDAAACTIQAGELEVAVEMLEQGRAIIWSKIRGYRHPLQDLREVNRGLADRFEAISRRLEDHSTFELLALPTLSFEAHERRYRRLSGDWDNVLDEIREIDGFQNFLQSIPYGTLKNAATGGPVIMINLSSSRSDAIIIRTDDDPVLVSLPEASTDNVLSLCSKLAKARSSDSNSGLGCVLKELWETVVEPITARLGELGVQKGSRIWWCPTGGMCALPLHAAGPYSRGQKNLPDLYISSYTPTLSALISSRKGMAPMTVIPSLLVVAEPDESLVAVDEEVRHIQQLGAFVDVLFGKEANHSSVLESLKTHHCVHFACHGHRNDQPFRSSFQLHAGEPLELLDIIKARMPAAELAFLSACHSAAADIEGTPDEVIHLASALQFSGFRSVVGTFWAMADIDGPDVAEDFYRYMFRDREGEGAGWDVTDSAVALNLATKAMRRRGVGFLRWTNFIHIGA